MLMKAAPQSTTPLLDRLEVASTDLEARDLVPLFSLVEQLAQRFGLSAPATAGEVLADLAGAALDVPLYVLRPGDTPRKLLADGDSPQDGQTSTLSSANARAAALASGDRGALLSYVSLEARRIPSTRSELLGTLRSWWVDGRPSQRRRAAEVVAVPTAYAACLRAAAEGSKRAPPAVPLGVNRDDLVPTSLSYDSACLALFYERRSLAGAPAPMKTLMAKYSYSDGHLRKCVRHGEAIFNRQSSSLPDPAQASVFSLAARLAATTSKPGKRRKSA